MTTRNSSIDSIRTFAVFAVILIHTYPFLTFSGKIETYLCLLINQASRFAVPFFFIIAGYLWGNKLKSTELSGHMFAKYFLRVGMVFIFWCAVYVLVPNYNHVPDYLPIIKQFGLDGFLKVTYKRLIYYYENPVTFFFQGTEIHLWYLTALLSAVSISAIFIKLNLRKFLIPFSTLLYAVGLMAGSYAATPIGFSMEFNTRNGPFFSTLLFAAGLYLSETNRTFSVRHALSLIIIGFTLHMFEVWLLLSRYKIIPIQHDYLIGTLPFSLGFALLALSKPNLGGKNILSKIGIYTLGIYAIHLVFINLLHPLKMRFQCHIIEIIYPLIIFLLSLSASWFFSMNRITRRFVT